MTVAEAGKTLADEKPPAIHPESGSLPAMKWRGAFFGTIFIDVDGDLLLNMIL